MSRIIFSRRGPSRTTVNKICDEKINDAITSIYTLAGSISFSELPPLSQEYLGYVYEITEDFITTSDFVEGAGKQFPASTNVTIVNRGSASSPVYKYDASIGDMSAFQTKHMETAIGNETTVEGALEYLEDTKVDKVTGKDLSTNDFTTAEKTKLAEIESGAEVNVQSDWSQTDNTQSDFVKNKPTKVSEFTNDSSFITKSVSNLENYYTKAEIDALIAGTLQLDKE